VCDMLKLNLNFCAAWFLGVRIERGIISRRMPYLLMLTDSDFLQ
jgi:hypothetical protein